MLLTKTLWNADGSTARIRMALSSASGEIVELFVLRSGAAQDTALARSAGFVRCASADDVATLPATAPETAGALYRSSVIDVLCPASELDAMVAALEEDVATALAESATVVEEGDDDLIVALESAEGPYILPPPA